VDSELTRAGSDRRQQVRELDLRHARIGMARTRRSRRDSLKSQVEARIERQ
jgi:hypothetical protein